MQKVIDVDIKDMEKTLKFRIRLFDALTGIDFLDKRVGKGTLSVKECLGDLLPLSTMLNTATGEALEQMSLEKANVYFENPLAVVELGLKIMEHQTVFMKSSEVFRPYLALLEKAYPSLISGNQILSATS